MTFGTHRVSMAVVAAVLLTVVTGHAHHAISAKFDETKTTSISGIVTLVDWRNPHVHVFMNVKNAKGVVENWAAELQSPIELQQNGWTSDSLKPGANVTVNGLVARNGSRQVWANTVTSGGKPVFTVKAPTPPPATGRPAPRGPDNHPLLGQTTGSADGYWAYPSSTVLVEKGVNVAINRDGLLKTLADASKVAPMQPWA